MIFHIPLEIKLKTLKILDKGVAEVIPDAFPPLKFKGFGFS